MARIPELFSLGILVLATVGMQLLIGGTRLVFSLPIYALLAVVGLLGLFSLRRPKPPPDGLCLWSSAIFFGYILVRGWFSPEIAIARPDLFSVLGGLVIYLFVAFILTEAKRRMYLLLCLVLVALVQVVIGAVQFRNGDNFMLIPFLQRFDYGRRASGFYVCPNHFAGLLEVLGVFCVSLVCWSRWPVWAKLLIGYAGAVCYAGQALTGSRGGYISASVSLIVVAALTLIVLRKAGSTIFWRATLGGGVLALVLAGALFLGLTNSDYLSGRAQNLLDTQNMRVDLWRAAIEQWKLQPLLGTGSGTYLYYGRRFRAERVQLDPVKTHNDYLQLLCEYGALAGAAFVFFFGAHVRQGWRSFQRLGPKRAAISSRLPSNNLALNIGALGAVAAYVVHSFFDFNLHIPANVLLLAFVFGVLANPGFERQPNEAASGIVYGRVMLPLLAFALAAGCIRYWPAEFFAERARVALGQERHMQAIFWAKKAVTWDQQNPETFFYLGEARVRAAENVKQGAARDSLEEAALPAFQRALALAPNDERFLIALGRIYDSLGRYAEAEWMFGRARAWDPRSEVAQKSYAAHLARWSGEGKP